MEEQRSIFHANGVPLKYSIHRVTRACPPSSCRVHSSAFFLFLFSSSLFVVKKKKKIVSYLGQGRASPLIPWPLLSLLEIVVPQASQVTATDVSVCYRARSAEKGDYSRWRKFESDSWSFVAPLHLYFAVNRTRGILSSRFERGIQTRWRIIFEQTFK